MKRVIIQRDIMDDVAVAIADITEIVEQYFYESEGFTRQKSHDYFTIVLDTDGTEIPRDNDFKKGEEVRIILRAEMLYEDFVSIVDKLNSAVQKIDADAYFDAYDIGIYVCTISLNNSKASEHTIVNQKNVEYAVDRTIKQVNNSLDETFKLIEVYLSEDPNNNDDHDLVRIYVEAQSKDYETLAYMDIRKSDIISVQQLKADIIDEMYSKLINAVTLR